LAEGVCRRVAEGRDDAAIRLALAQRAWSMLPAPEWASIAREGALSAGDPTAPVELVAFASPRGVHCSRVVPALHRAVTAGPLRGKVHLALVLFPLRANEHDKEAGLALLAAEPSGASWELLLTGYERFDAFGLEAQRGWAVELGLDPAELERRAADPALLARLAEGKRQGAELGVDATPTFFLDGRRWQGELDPVELIDALEEAWERSQGLACRGEPS